MILNIVNAFLYGLGIGFINSIPIGPINVSIIDTSFKRGFSQAFMIGAGALIVDIGYCIIAVFGVSMVQTYVEQMFLPLGFPVLSILGGRLIYKGYSGTSVQTFHPATQTELTKNFSLGFLIYLSNPLAVGFWIFAAGFLYSYKLLHHTMVEQTIFVTGMAIGTAAWFLLLAKFVAWKRATVSESTIRRITMGTGFVLIAFGIYLGLDYALTFQR